MRKVTISNSLILLDYSRYKNEKALNLLRNQVFDRKAPKPAIRQRAVNPQLQTFAAGLEIRKADMAGQIKR